MEQPPAPPPRPPNDRGQGRKPISKSGSLTRNRVVTLTDSEWADCAELAGDMGRSGWIRTQIAKGIKALRRKP